MSRIRRHEWGMSLPAILTILVLVSFFATLVAKLSPSYVSFWTLRSILDDYAETGESFKGGASALLDRIMRRLEVNDVRGLGRDDFTIEKIGANEYDVTVDYERRIHLFANLDAVLSFDHSIVVEGQ